MWGVYLARGDGWLYYGRGVSRGDGAWRLLPRPGLGSADIFAGVDADAYLRLPPGEHRLSAGEAITFQWIGERS